VAAAGARVGCGELFVGKLVVHHLVKDVTIGELSGFPPL
jgi:hypothetical protein